MVSKTEFEWILGGNLQDMNLVWRDHGAKRIEKMLNFKKFNLSSSSLAVYAFGVTDFQIF